MAFPCLGNLSSSFARNAHFAKHFKISAFTDLHVFQSWTQNKRNLEETEWGVRNHLFLESFSMRRLIKGWFLSPGSPYVRTRPRERTSRNKVLFIMLKHRAAPFLTSQPPCPARLRAEYTLTACSGATKYWKIFKTRFWIPLLLKEGRIFYKTKKTIFFPSYIHNLQGSFHS